MFPTARGLIENKLRQTLDKPGKASAQETTKALGQDPEHPEFDESIEVGISSSL